MDVGKKIGGSLTQSEFRTRLGCNEFLRLIRTADGDFKEDFGGSKLLYKRIQTVKKEKRKEMSQ